MKIVPKQFSLPVLFIGNFFLAIVFAGLVTSQQAFAADEMEVETNHPIVMGQFITPGMLEYEVSGVIGNLSGSVVDDVDFYKFYGQEGDVVTVDIDGGWGGARDVDTEIAIFGEGPTFRKWRGNDDASIDAGSISRKDARVENFTLPATGVYYIGVAHWSKRFVSGGEVYGSTGQNGDYMLVVSGVTGSPAVLHINIDVKPGKENISPLNPKAKGRVPVALLSADNFDPADVDVSSLTFGHDGDEASLEKCNKGSADFNKDGVKELICHFDNQTASFRKGDEEGVLKGKLKDGTLIEGRGLLKVVGEKAN
jgi:hypothetical protein